MLIMFSGVPGSGKSTLAQATARHFQLPLFTRDSIQGFLYQRELINQNTVDGYLLMLQLAEEQLALGNGAILDGTFPQIEFREQAETIARRYQLPFKAIYCFVSDTAVWKKRWYKRRAENTVSHWMEFTWEDVLHIKQHFQKWNNGTVLELDAMNPVEENLTLLFDFLR